VLQQQPAQPNCHIQQQQHSCAVFGFKQEPCLPSQQSGATCCRRKQASQQVQDAGCAPSTGRKAARCSDSDSPSCRQLQAEAQVGTCCRTEC
jgi:hypothetical protein